MEHPVVSFVENPVTHMQLEPPLCFSLSDDLCLTWPIKYIVKSKMIPLIALSPFMQKTISKPKI